MSLGRRIVLVDSETSAFGRHEGHSALLCAAEAAARLLNRQPARTIERIGLIAVGAARMAPAEGIGNGLPQHIARLVGLPGISGTEVHAFCASANAAVRHAALTLEAGQCDAALVVGMEHLLAVNGRGPLQPEAAPAEAARGYSPATFYALCAARYLHETGAPLSALAQVAVNNRRHAAGNPNARFREPVTLAQVLESRLISAPLTLLQCCPQADGAGALLLAGADAIEPSSIEHGAELIGLGSCSASSSSSISLTSFAEDVKAGRTAYGHASVSPEDIDIVELHDAFTISQVIHLEDLALAPRGEGWRHALRETRPLVNPGGGLLSRGHPLGATGIAQFDAVRRALSDRRVDAGLRRLGLVHEAGGLWAAGQLLSECAVLRALDA